MARALVFDVGPLPQIQFWLFEERTCDVVRPWFDLKAVVKIAKCVEPLVNSVG